METHQAKNEKVGGTDGRKYGEPITDYLSHEIIFEDIVFEGRNTAYGGYELRTRYSNRVLRSILIAVSAFVLALVGPVLWENFGPNEAIVEEKLVPIDMTNLPPPPPVDPNTPPPPPTPAAPQPPKLRTVRFVPPEIMEDDEVTEKEPPSQKDLTNAVSATTTQEGDPNADPNEIVVNQSGNGNGIVAPPIEEEVELFAVEQEPEFPGGMDKMAEYLRKNVKYPFAAVKAEVQGVVYVSVLVAGDGNISEVKVFKGIGFGCDEEAVRVVSSMPPWTPAKMNGKNVKVRMQIPIRFKLSN